MATKKINNNEVRVPFFGDKISFITGLDPLGLQNPSSRAYTYLLNGLNVVSRRIRNYSFYCWLLSEYSKKVSTRDPRIQREFIRKAEYIIALGSVANKLEGINGSTYASKKLDTEANKLTLSEGIYNQDGSTDETYWKFGFGIFGQYYMGSMRQIRIIEEIADEFRNPLGIFRVTKDPNSNYVTGEELAIAFAENIPIPKQQLLLSCIESDEIHRDQMFDLFPEFNMFEVPQGSQENSLLIKMIMDADDPKITQEDVSFNRRDTFLHVLKFANQNSESLQEHNFTRHSYYHKGMQNDELDETLFGWYYYQFNEFFRLACTACLNGILNRLEEEEGWIHLFELIDISVNEIIANLSLDSQTSAEQPLSQLLNNKFEVEQTLCNLMLKSKRFESMTYAIQLLLKLHQENKDYLESLNEYVIERGIHSDVDVLSFYLRDFNRYMEMTLEDFLKNLLLHQVIYRHQNVAYRKMVGSQTTQKFIIEDNYIRHIGNFAPDYTASRVGTVIGFMQDLHMIDGENHLTGTARKLLREINDN